MVCRQATNVVPLQQNKQESLSLMKTAALCGAAVFLFGACATKPVVDGGSAAKTESAFGQWRGQGSASRAMSDGAGGTKQENWSVNLEVVSRTPGYGRIEVTGAMGVYGGTIAWTPKETRILMPGQRKFVTAPNSPKSFVSILPFQVSPAEVEAILFDRDFDTKNFKARGIGCRMADGGGKETCVSAKGFVLERTRGAMDMVAFEVSTEDGAHVKMQLKPVKSKVEERGELWALDAPKGFKVIRQ